MNLINDAFSDFKKKSRARFDFPFFKDSSIQSEIARQGYSVQPLLDQLGIEQLNKDFETLLNIMAEPLPNTHWTSGRVEEKEIRNFARKSIDKVLPQRLLQYFNPETTDFVGGIFLAKKPSQISELTAHQDSSLVDETKFPAVYAWVPLCDVDVFNGAMHVLPGSHLWGNRFRSLNIPWLYAGMEADMQPFLKPVPMKAGQVLFFDSAAIHYSSNNLNTLNRVAVNYFVKPKQALLLHHYIAPDTPSGTVEVYNIDIDFFYSEDFMERPKTPPYKKLESEKYDIKVIGRDMLDDEIGKYIANKLEIL